MSGFIYKGKSTDTILSSSKLIIATFTEVSEIVGHDREDVVGDTTITRQVANEYGTIYSGQTFEYSLIKNNLEPFTEEEQILVESWLSSPKFSSTLQLIDCEGTVIGNYTGKFTHTEWVTSAGGWAGVNFTFKATSPYMFEEHTQGFTIDGSSSITIDCDSDEYEEYIYPVVEIYAKDETNTVTITNKTDNNNELKIEALHRLRILIDCDHCTLTDATTNGIISFDDVGWKDVGNIYWLRFITGENNLRIIGNAIITFKYKTVNKKVGGWL